MRFLSFIRQEIQQFQRWQCTRALRCLLFIFGIYAHFALAQAQHLPPFSPEDQPAAPDYSQEKYWSALPFRKDAPDVTPWGEKWISDSLKKVDVFYIYPTLFMNGKTWNADVDKKSLNRRIDHYPVKFQASIFNHVGRVYAPRYRQAIIDSYHDKTGSGEKALDFAYQDIRRAFEYYMEHYNQGRPIIIASHSQGTTHSRRLLKDYFDNPEMKAKLVCAYAVGFALHTTDYQLLTPCDSATQTNCYVGWASFREGYRYEGELPYFGDVCVNPLSWTRDSVSVQAWPGILLNIKRKRAYESSAQIMGKQLMVRTKMPLMRHRDVLHLVDFNLFWKEIRRNAGERVAAYFKTH
jgi:hypothetical protein